MSATPAKKQSAKPEKPAKPLTPKQAKFVKLMPLIKGGELTVEEAMKRAGYSDKTARQQTDTMKAIRQNSAMQEALRKAGFTEELIAKSVVAGMKAKTKAGSPELNTRHQYLRTGAELLDAFPAKRQINTDMTLEALIKAQEAAFKPGA